MALSYKSVQAAYIVFNQLKAEFGIPKRIPTWPTDMEECTNEEKDNPLLNTVHGWSKKSDAGWENIFFLVENPSKELKARFEELKKVVPNSSMNKQYSRNPKLWIIGWF